MLYNLKIAFVVFKKLILQNLIFYSLVVLILSIIGLISVYITTDDIKYGSIFILSFILLLIFLTFIMDFINTFKEEKTKQYLNELNDLRYFTYNYMHKLNKKNMQYDIVTLYVSEDVYKIIPTVENVDYAYVIILDKNRSGYDIGLYKKGSIINNVNEFFYE